jgi:hypothetical protein
MKKFLKGAVVLLVAIAMLFSTVALADTQIKEAKPELNTAHSGSGNGARQNVVWDNGMNYDNMMSAQRDTAYPYDCFLADDFHFEETTEVCDVHWIGGYWGTNYQTGAFDWCISFMFDDGSGTAPDSHPETPSYAGPFCYSWDDITKELLEDTGSSIYYELSVDLPYNIVMEPCQKIWISIWGVGYFPPQSGWGSHQDPILLYPAVWGSTFWGYPFWTDGYDIQGYDHDMCFQLTTKEDPVPPTAPTIDGPPEGNPGVEYAFTFHSYDDNGDMVRYHIDWGDGTSEVTDWYPACTPVTVYHTYASKGTYVITAYAEDETGLVSPSTSFTIIIPRNKAINNPLLQFLQGHPNMFPLIQLILQRLGLF